MPTAKNVRLQIQVLEERLARLRLARSQLVARATQAERKRDTRRKIIIGGTVLAALEREGVPALRTKAELVAWLDGRLDRPGDRVVFELPRRHTP